MLHNSPRVDPKVHLFTFNPNWNVFSTLSFKDKLIQAQLVIETCEKQFLAMHERRLEDLCIIVFPDLMFAMGHDDHDTVCKVEQLKKFECFLKALQINLSSNILVIPGAIEWLHDNYYQISSYFVGHNKMQRYDKKHSSNDLKYQNHNYKMKSGDQSGVFEFNGVHIGLEICQDHECHALKSELGHHFVDIHILIANGQNKRTRSVATLPGKGLFVVCELEQGKTPYSQKKFEHTACYQVNHTVRPSNQLSSNNNNNMTWSPRFIQDQLGTSLQLRLDELEPCSRNEGVMHVIYTMPEAMHHKIKRHSHHHKENIVNGVIKNSASHQSQFINDLKAIFHSELDGLADEVTLPKGITDIYTLFQHNNHPTLQDIIIIVEGRLDEYSPFRSSSTLKLYYLFKECIETLNTDKLENQYDVYACKLIEIEKLLNDIVNQAESTLMYSVRTSLNQFKNNNK